MLGADGERRYLIAFMTPAESRGYDGLIGSYGVLSAEDGHLSLSASGSVSDIQDALPTGGAQLTGVADYLARYGAFDPGLFPQDLAYSPDLPTDADVLAQVYAQSLGGHIDGVLAVDPYGLAALLRFTGPIEVPGLPFALTQANAARVLLSEQYTTFDTGDTNQDLHPSRLLALCTPPCVRQPGQREPARTQRRLCGARPSGEEPGASRSGASTATSSLCCASSGSPARSPRPTGATCWR